MDLMNLMKNAGKIKSMFAEKQEAQSNATYHGEAGAGWVKITMKGNGSVTNIELSDDVLKENKEILTELLIAAFNDCNNKITQQQKEDMNSLSDMFGGSMPAGFGGSEEKGE